MRSRTIKSIAVLYLVLGCVGAQGTVIQASSVSTDMGVFNSLFSITSIIDTGGLSTPYTSGVTDFDSYVATTTQDSVIDIWVSDVGTSGTVTFDFGAAVVLDALALWNVDFFTNGDPSAQAAVRDFALYADDDAVFGNGTLGAIQSFTAAATTLPHPAQLFEFTATSLRYLHLGIENNHGAFATGIADVVFRQGTLQSPPTNLAEPGSVEILTLGLVVLGASRLRRRAMFRMRTG